MAGFEVTTEVLPGFFQPPTKARQQGRPTADAKDLDVDVILAAQAPSFGPAPSDMVIATSNAKHLSQFITAQNWSEILP